MEILEIVSYIGTVVASLGAMYTIWSPRIKRTANTLIDAGQALIEIDRLMDDIFEACKDNNVSEAEMKEIIIQAKVTRKELDDVFGEVQRFLNEIKH